MCGRVPRVHPRLDLVADARNRAEPLWAQTNVVWAFGRWVRGATLRRVFWEAKAARPAAALRLAHWGPRWLPDGSMYDREYFSVLTKCELPSVWKWNSPAHGPNCNLERVYAAFARC